jgi:outer membrane protein TolC
LSALGIAADLIDARPCDDAVMSERRRPALCPTGSISRFIALIGPVFLVSPTELPAQQWRASFTTDAGPELTPRTKIGTGPELTPPAKTDTGPELHAPSKLTTPTKPAAAYGLEECLYLALHNQPALSAERASLAAAEDGWRALEALRVPTLLARDLPARRHQAALGVAAASARVDRAERDTIYAVTRTYMTVLYARTQEKVARGVVERLASVNEAAARMLKAGARDVTTSDVERTRVYVDLAEAKRIQAAKGSERALAALGEAIGLDPTCPFQVADGQLPEPSVQPSRQEVVAAALARRGDLLQTNLFAELTCLEVEAQRKSLHARMETFAIGADIHSQQVPQGMQNSEYRPAALSPEMPPKLFGTRPWRLEQAQDYHMRAAAVVEKTRNLIALEAADAFLRWEEAAEQSAATRRAADNAEKMSNGLRKDFLASLKVKVEDVMNAQVLAAQARSQYTEYLYHQILALADLERVTAGGFSAGLAGPPRPPALCLIVK